MVSEDLLRVARLRSSVSFAYRHRVDVDPGLKRDFQSPALGHRVVGSNQGPQSPAGKQAARVQLRNSDLASTIRVGGLASPLGSQLRSAFDRWKSSGVSDWQLAEPRAAPLCCPLTGAKTRDMSIREASPLGQYPTPPAGSDVLTTSSIPAHDLPEPPKPRLLD